MSHHFLFIESNTTGSGALAVRRLLERGDRVTFLAGVPAKYPVLADPAPGLTVVQQDTNDLESVAGTVAEIHGRERVDAILTFSEFYVVTVAEIAERLGFRHLSPQTARICRDKPSTRRALRNAGLATPGFWPVATADEAARVAGSISYPAVVKPPADSSSKGVRLVRDAGELMAHFHLLHARRWNDRGQALTGEVLIETLLEGPELSVETLTLASGRTHVIGITAKHLSPPPLFVETGHDFPAEIAAATRDRLAGAAVAALDAVGFDFGPAHTEIRLTAAGPVVVEINPRLAGGMIPELIRHATGIDLLAVVLDQLLGLPLDLTPCRAETAAIRFFTAEREGRLARVDRLHEAGQIPALREISIGKSLGAAVRPAEEAADRLGYAIAAGPGRLQVMAAAEEARRTLRIHIEAMADDLPVAPLRSHAGGASELFG
ncbi:MAG TPA: ATP-grasp domain-containing protein [Thermoanaerobaculia bacterium]|nr:ATP-grasp domain-containing protein [Thermoanaerobaculia bacterium]